MGISTEPIVICKVGVRNLWHIQWNINIISRIRCWIILTFEGVQIRLADSIHHVYSGRLDIFFSLFLFFIDLFLRQ